MALHHLWGAGVGRKSPATPRELYALSTFDRLNHFERRPISYGLTPTCRVGSEKMRTHTYPPCRRRASSGKITYMRTATTMFIASATMLVACAPGAPEPVCVPGAAVACTCDGDTRGAKACNVTGQFARCACHARGASNAAPSPTATTSRRRPVRSCSTVANHFAQLALQNMWNDLSGPDDEASNELLETTTEQLTERCEVEQWSEATMDCLLAATDIEEARPCGAL